MNESKTREPKSRALSYLLAGFLIVIAASYIASDAINRPMLDASGKPIHVDDHPYPLYEIDTAATLRANIPAYICALTGLGFIVRAAIIRFGSKPTRDETTNA
ncbi:MAG: hypothetical protein ABIP20_00860 [Chthoniobacteraceae bacterium]